MTMMHAYELDNTAPLTEKPLTWREIPQEKPGPGQILIKVVACGVCRSNLHMIEGDWPGVPSISPIIPGHEVTGHVAAVGEGVSDFAIGDAVGVQPLWYTCEECEYCRSGQEQLCYDRKMTGEDVNGGYGEFMLANAAHTYHIPDGLDLVEIAPLFCPGITAYGIVDKLDIGPGDVVGVFGLGGVGHMVVQFALLTGAEVVAVGRNAEHLKVALELGAARAVNTTEPGAAETLRESLNAAITFADSDEVTALALSALKRGGTLATGIPLTVDNFGFAGGHTIKTSVIGSRKQMRKVLELAAEGKIRTVTEKFALEDAPLALERLADGTLQSRAVLVVHEH